MTSGDQYGKKGGRQEKRVDLSRVYDFSTKIKESRHFL